MKSRIFTMISGGAWLAIVGILLLVIAASGDRVQSLLGNTMWLSISVATISTVLGTILALLITRTDLPLRRWAVIPLLILFFTPLYLQAAGWDAGFGRQGWYSYTHGSLALPLLSGWRAAIWIHTIAALPWSALIVGVGLRYIEPALEEMALLEGSPWQVFRHVTLPLSAPAILASFLWVAVSTAGEMTVTDMYQVRTYAEEIYTTFALGEDAGLSASQQWCLNLVVLASLVLIVLRFATRLAPAGTEHVGTEHAGRPPLVFSLGSLRWPACLFVLGVVIVAAGIPLANLFYNAGVRVEQIGTTRVRSWDLFKFFSILREMPVRYASEWWWSTVIGVLSATLGLIVAVPLAWGARDASRTNWKKWPALLVASGALAIPGPLVGLMLIGLLNRDRPEWLAELYDHSVLAPVLAVTIRSLPLTLLVTWFALRSFPQRWLEEAAIDGAGALGRWFLVVLPNRLPSLLAVWLLAFTLAIGDLSASILVLPPSTQTLSFSIFQLAHAGVDDRLAGLCLVSVAFFAVLAAAICWLLGKIDPTVNVRAEETNPSPGKSSSS